MEVALFVEPPAVQEERMIAAEHSTVADGEVTKVVAAKLGAHQTPNGNSNLQRSSSTDQMDSVFKKQVSPTFSSEFASVMDSTSSRPSSSNAKDSDSLCRSDQLESTKHEIGEIKEENERLKMVLSQIVKDYQSLQKQFLDMIRQEKAKKPVDQPMAPSPSNAEEESELVFLSLGTSSNTGHKNGDKTNATEAIKDRNNLREEGLALGLDCRYDGFSNTSANEAVSIHSLENSSDQETAKDEEPGADAWPPSKVLKSSRNGDDEIKQQPQVKKARVSIRARCDAPTMNDGCQWRKYGQKVAKGNPCPRAYYRCTVAPSCPVRKQVQRCAEDLSILITTYEGTHNHPLPVSATAMASTTSAAASMLLAGSSSSQPLAIDSINSSSTSTCTDTTFHGLNFGLSETSRTRPFYQLPNTSISSTPSYPTITLDLTTPQSSSGSSHANHFSRFSANLANTAGVPRYNSTSFNFSSSEKSSLPLSWSNGSNLSYGSSSNQQYNMSAPLGSLSLSRLSQEHFWQSFLQGASTNVPTAAGASSNHAFTDTIAKALTSDPSFHSALKEAITSFVGTQGGAPTQSTATTPVSACASSLLNRSTSSSGSNTQLQGSTLFLQPFLAFSSSKSASPVDHRSENTN